MERLKGHGLRRAFSADDGKAQWECECGHPIGDVSTHKAREIWREHKASLPDEASA